MVINQFKDQNLGKSILPQYLSLSRIKPGRKIIKATSTPISEPTDKLKPKPKDI